MADDAAEAVRFHRRHFLQQILNHRPANRDEGVAVVEAERREFVALTAEVQSLSQGEFAGVGSKFDFPIRFTEDPASPTTSAQRNAQGVSRPTVSDGDLL